jgi:hypothetical protein
MPAAADGPRGYRPLPASARFAPAQRAVAQRASRGWVERHRMSSPQTTGRECSDRAQLLRRRRSSRVSRDRGGRAVTRSSRLARTAWRSSLAVAAGAVALVACGGTQPRPTTLTCSDSIYTASVRPGGKPKAFNAVEIGPAIFNDLRGAQDASQLERSGSLLTYKSPLTIAATGKVRIAASSLHRGRIALLYAKNVPDRLAAGGANIADFPAALQFRLCGTRGSALRVPQFAGGFGVSQAGCYRIKVSIGNRSMSRVVSFGAGSACPTEA